ncbi:hypothetical protein POM88_017747 [Heracleum sosnowskyi]|uniref:HECT-type E3 ubiquitin transferase n=1 Tax=Heracleum sosnowskyi TaxID=360622 RepID=A0AAD8MYA0_9APIA|nr:hypothetical protein POM88_017747 [Heracleum sosnowskyi]
MAGPRQHQVSLRGASAKEITRDALLERVSQERELRNYTRRATSAALFIQRVWRSYNSTKMIALQLQRDWRKMISCHTRYRKIQARDVDCMQTCFRILLESLNSTDPQKNFCTLSTCSPEERRIWLYQAKKLISLCLLILAECDYTRQGANEFVLLASLGMRFLVMLTDAKGWRCNFESSIQDASNVVKDLIQFMGSNRSDLYVCVRSYIIRLDAPFPQVTGAGHKDEKVLITASAITISLRPFHMLDTDKNGSLEVQHAAEHFCIFLLTIPWFAQRLPAVLLSSLRHKSVLSRCLRALLISKERILKEISKVDQLMISSLSRMMPQVGWALGNILYLTTGSDHILDGHGNFTQDLDYELYVHVVIILAEDVLTCLEKVGGFRKVNQDSYGNAEGSDESVETTLIDVCTTNMSYMDYFKPVVSSGIL